MKNKTIIIAIDGESAAGKGTLAKLLAERLDFDYLDTGLLYRFVAYLVIQQNISISDVQGIVSTVKQIETMDLSTIDLRDDTIATMASKISTVKELRDALTVYQRDFATKTKKLGVILDGRDIGTVIYPNADVKFYVTASLAIRVRRRFNELKHKGISISLQEVERSLQNRDKSDKERENGALKQAQNAILLDTSNLTIAQALEQALTTINKNIIMS